MLVELVVVEDVVDEIEEFRRAEGVHRLLFKLRQHARIDCSAEEFDFFLRVVITREYLQILVGSQLEMFIHRVGALLILVESLQSAMVGPLTHVFAHHRVQVSEDTVHKRLALNIDGGRVDLIDERKEVSVARGCPQRLLAFLVRENNDADG